MTEVDREAQAGLGPYTELPENRATYKAAKSASERIVLSPEQYHQELNLAANKTADGICKLIETLVRNPVFTELPADKVLRLIVKDIRELFGPGSEDIPA